MVPDDLLSRARAALLAADRVVPHTDADGLAAGALALRARGEGAERAVLLGRGEVPWGEEPPLPPGSVALLDWGVRPFTRPGVIVDHHAPEVAPDGVASENAREGVVAEVDREGAVAEVAREGVAAEVDREGVVAGVVPEDVVAGVDAKRMAPAAPYPAVVLTSYGAVPETPTAPLTRRLVPEQPAWLAALGAVGDLGDAGFALAEAAGAPKTAIRRLAPLINAPRRLPDGPVRTALALLVEHEEPKGVLADPRIAELEAAKREWRAGFDAAVRTAPLVGDRAAVLRFRSPYQVHPLVATTWARRLAPRVVLAANEDYLPGMVNFAVRGGDGQDLRRVLREALPDEGGEFAHGHDRATGGSLAPEAFDRLVAALGVRPRR